MAHALLEQIEEHNLLLQSVDFMQNMLLEHMGHPPPQSISVSSPFFIWSVQDGLAQAPATQFLLTQSVLLKQLCDTRQRGQIDVPDTEPPQSISDSFPFFTSSLHHSG
jgi:hypothetical protein